MVESFEFNPDEIKKSEEKLNDRLQKMLLLLYLLEIDKRICVSLGLKIIQEEYDKIIAEISRQTTENGFTSIPEVNYRDYLKRVEKDWPRIVEEAPLKLEPSKPDNETINRAALIGWFLAYNMFGGAIIQVAKNEGFTVVEWVTMKDPDVCELCLENEGFHQVHSVPEYPAHPACRCRLKIWVITRNDAPITIRFDVGDLYQYRRHI